VITAKAGIFNAWQFASILQELGFIRSFIDNLNANIHEDQWVASSIFQSWFPHQPIKFLNSIFFRSQYVL
jgi:hypothetical protein